MSAPGVAAEPKQDFAALEGWRGVCAVLVALYHFRNVFGITVNAHVASWWVVRNAYLFVDFFFVLSGFVIAASYQDRLAGRLVSLRAFLLLRLGRLYPLHVFTLGIMVLLEAFFRYGTAGATRLSIPAAEATPAGFLANVFLVHGLHTLPQLTWNHPSWSISTEFATYVAYALLWIGLGRLTWIASALVIVAAPAAILVLHGDINVTYDWGFLRSMLGFALGVTVFNARRRPLTTSQLGRLTRTEATVLEMLLAAAAYAFAVLAGGTIYSVAAPFLFAGVVLLFAEARGAPAAALASPPMRTLGRLSYSIYLLHFPLQQVLIYLTVLAGSSGWTWLFDLATSPSGREAVLGRSPWVGDAAYALMLVLLVAVSAATWRGVEAPSRAWVRRRVAR